MSTCTQLIIITKSTKIVSRTHTHNEREREREGGREVIRASDERCG